LIFSCDADFVTWRRGQLAVRRLAGKNAFEIGPVRQNVNVPAMDQLGAGDLGQYDASPREVVQSR